MVKGVQWGVLVPGAKVAGLDAAAAQGGGLARHRRGRDGVDLAGHEAEAVVALLDDVAVRGLFLTRRGLAHVGEAVLAVPAVVVAAAVGARRRRHGAAAVGHDLLLLVVVVVLLGVGLHGNLDGLFVLDNLRVALGKVGGVLVQGPVARGHVDQGQDELVGHVVDEQHGPADTLLA